MLSLGTVVFSKVLAGYRPLSHQMRVTMPNVATKPRVDSLDYTAESPGSFRDADVQAHPQRRSHNWPGVFKLPRCSQKAVMTSICFYPTDSVG